MIKLSTESQKKLKECRKMLSNIIQGTTEEATKNKVINSYLVEAQTLLADVQEEENEVL